jgi:hypothetical protein
MPTFGASRGSKGACDDSSSCPTTKAHSTMTPGPTSPSKSVEDIVNYYDEIHFEGCCCDECAPFNKWMEDVQARIEEKKLLSGEDKVEITAAELGITAEDLSGDVDNFNFEKEARTIIENRRNEMMESLENLEKVPTPDELEAMLGL